jgi:apolipoprotein N-acyltransferase
VKKLAFRNKKNKPNFYEEDPREENPILYQNNSALEHTMKKKLKMGAYHLFVLLSWLLASSLLVRMVLIMGSLMWFATAISAHVIVNEQKSILERGYQVILGYSWGLLGYKLILSILMGVPAKEWGRVLQVSMPQAYASTLAGYARLLFGILLIMIPVGYGGYLGSQMFVFKSHKKVNTRRKEIMRTGDQDYK